MDPRNCPSELPVYTEAGDIPSSSSTLVPTEAGADILLSSSTDTKAFSNVVHPHGVASQLSFANLGLKGWLVNGLSSLEIEQPSKTQERIMPLFLGGHSFLLQQSQQPCSGKTTACITAILHFIDWHDPAPQALLMFPTRELAQHAFDLVVSLRNHATVCNPKGVLTQGHHCPCGFDLLKTTDAQAG